LGKSPWYQAYLLSCVIDLTRREQSFEHVLANINKLNRSLEAVITVRPPSLLSLCSAVGECDADWRGGEKVGNEFSSVEALWSQFEGVMAKDAEEGGAEGSGSGGDGEGEGEGETVVDDGHDGQREEERRGGREA